MTVFNEAIWHHVLARQLQIKPSHAHALERLAVLPDHGIRDEALAYHHDLQCIRDIERHRPIFDTESAPFIADLRALAALLLEGNNEDPPSKALVEFRQFSFGTDKNGLYPITRYLQPWRAHRVPVTVAQLDAAGYRQFAKMWKPDADPYSNVPVGGEVPVGPFQWVYSPGLWPALRPARAAFIARLADVLAVPK
jgi:hypothetical protein